MADTGKTPSQTAASRLEGTVAEKTGEAKGPPDMLPGPDALFGLWTVWMERHAGLPQNWCSSAGEWWQIGAPDDQFGRMLAGGVEQLSSVLASDPMLHSIDQMWNANPLRDVIPVDWGEIARALRVIWFRSYAEPDKSLSAAVELNRKAWQSAIDVWNEAGRRWLGTDGSGSSPMAPADKRFAAPEWHGNPIYRTLKELYLLASDWLLQHGETVVAGMEEAEQQRIKFHLRQFVDAMSPSLLVISNPDALRRALETGGTSFADSARNLLRDVRGGRLSMVDASAFAPGRNLALTPGKVVYRNKLVELIQYAPQTEAVHRTPLLILPPWINKYYILDMQPKNSLVRYLVDQGFIVFMISWKNPDASMEDTTFEDYMDLGPLACSDVVREITQSDTVNVMGYCIGGTLLAMTLAWLAEKADTRFRAATFMVSLMDFSRVGDTGVFLGEPGIDFIEQQMMERGYLDSREMSNMFNLLRSNDLIWSNVVNNYLLGNKPPAFDLLYWNSDGTRMARAAHSWYLRNTYVENNLIKPDHIHLKGVGLNLGRITLDTYAVGAEKDHIVPWDAAWRISQVFGGKVRFIRASSGHIAGVINPPGGKGAYWVVEGDTRFASPEEWLRAATRHEGSWWKDWPSWLAARSGPEGKPPPVGSARHQPLEDAPGTYVLEK